ncbi:hypothetical protein Tco_0033431 [Tanacetum coccineum]
MVRQRDFNLPEKNLSLESKSFRSDDHERSFRSAVELSVDHRRYTMYRAHPRAVRDGVNQSSVKEFFNLLLDNIVDFWVLPFSGFAQCGGQFCIRIWPPPQVILMFKSAFTGGKAGVCSFYRELMLPNMSLSSATSDEMHWRRACTHLATTALFLGLTS